MAPQPPVRPLPRCCACRRLSWVMQLASCAAQASVAGASALTCVLAAAAAQGLRRVVARPVAHRLLPWRWRHCCWLHSATRHTSCRAVSCVTCGLHWMWCWPLTRPVCWTRSGGPRCRCWRMVAQQTAVPPAPVRCTWTEARCGATSLAPAPVSVAVQAGACLLAASAPCMTAALQLRHRACRCVPRRFSRRRLMRWPRSSVLWTPPAARLPRMHLGWRDMMAAPPGCLGWTCALRSQATAVQLLCCCRWLWLRVRRLVLHPCRLTVGTTTTTASTTLPVAPAATNTAHRLRCLRQAPRQSTAKASTSRRWWAWTVAVWPKHVPSAPRRVLTDLCGRP